MDAAEESFDEAHLQSLASSLGKKNPATDADAPGVSQQGWGPSL